MNNTLFKRNSLLKLAAITSLAFTLMACSDSSDNVTYVILDYNGNEHPIPSDSLKYSSSVKRRSSSSFFVVASSSSVRAAVSSFSVGRVESSATVQSSSSVASVIPGSDPESSSSLSSSGVVASSSAKVASSSSVKIASSSAKAPASSAAQGGFFSDSWRQACLDKINKYRATENLGPLTLAPEEKQTCTDKQAGDDLAENKAHGHFGNCGEWAQNSGPNFNTSWRKTAIEVSDAYLKMMWEDEKALVTSGERDPKKDEDYPYIGHYLNMKGNYKTVACGIALSADGKKGWFNVNFF